MNSKTFLEQVKKKHDLHSDYALAKRLGVSQSRISAYMNGRREFDDAMAVQVADLIGERGMYVLAVIQAQRAKRTDIRRAWLALAKMAKKQKAAALILVVAISGLGGLSPQQAQAAASSGAQYTLCAY